MRKAAPKDSYNYTSANKREHSRKHAVQEKWEHLILITTNYIEPPKYNYVAAIAGVSLVFLREGL